MLVNEVLRNTRNFLNEFLESNQNHFIESLDSWKRKLFILILKDRKDERFLRKLQQIPGNFTELLGKYLQSGSIKLQEILFIFFFENAVERHTHTRPKVPRSPAPISASLKWKSCNNSSRMYSRKILFSDPIITWLCNKKSVQQLARRAASFKFSGFCACGKLMNLSFVASTQKPLKLTSIESASFGFDYRFGGKEAFPSLPMI